MSEPNMRKSSAASLPSLSVRIDLDTEGRIGPGKIQLLENIRTCGSISAAGRAMDMSYKRAWDLVDEINRICRHPAVERQTGGKNGGGAVLTPFGISLVGRYRKIERDAASAVRKELQALQTDIGRAKKSARRAERPRDLMALADIGGPDAGAETEARGIGAPDQLVGILERDRRDHRAENLLLRDPHIVLDVGEHGRRHEVT